MRRMVVAHGRQSSSAAVRLFGPIVLAAAHRSGGLRNVWRGSVALRLRQARLYSGLDDRDRVASYRLAVLGTTGCSLPWERGSPWSSDSPPGGAGGLLGCGLAGALRVRGRLDRTLTASTKMKIEISTIQPNCSPSG